MHPAEPARGADGFWTARRFLLGMLLVILAVFPKVILGLTAFFFRDAGALGYPCAYYFQQSLQHGELPLWNPYSHCGVPYMAQMGQWYPGNWLCALLPLPWSVNLVLFAHLLLGGGGMYALTRRWGVGGFAATFAGLAYAFDGVTLSCFQWGNYIASLGWLPWVVLAVSQAWRQGGRWVAVAAVVSALQVLTATPELTLLGWLFLAALWLGEWCSGQIKFWHSSRRVVFVILLAAGLTMVQMLPFFDLLAHSQRDTNYQQSQWAMPGWGWANLIVPLFHCYLSPQGNWFQHDQDFLMSYYPGLGVLALAVVGVWYARNRSSLVVAGAVLVCWVLALGEAGHLLPLAKKVFPWLGVARFPVKFALLPAFLLPLLAAWAIQNIQTAEAVRARRVLLAAGGFLALLAVVLVVFAREYPLPYDATEAMTHSAIVRLLLLAALLGALLLLGRAKTPWHRQLIQFAALGILLADLLTHSPRIAPTLPSSVFASGIWQASGKPALALGAGRIMASPAAERQLLFSYVADPQLDFLGKRLAEWYNLNLLDSLPKVNGAMTLRPADFDRIERWIYFTPGAGYGAGLLDFLSAAWLFDSVNATQWIARSNFLPVITGGQRPEFLSDEKMLAAITAADFDPRAVVYLPENARPLVTVSNETRCAVKLLRFGQNQIEAEVQADTPSLIVLSQAYYHHWHAEVDGRETALMRANLAFQALQVPGGHHQLRLVYRDPWLRLGAGISIVSLLLCGVICLRRSGEKLDRSLVGD